MGKISPKFKESALRPQDFKPLKNVRKAEGRFLHAAIDVGRGWATFDTAITVPDEAHLMNFDVPSGTGGRAYKTPFLLVLDHYGDDQLPAPFRRAVFGTKYGETTLGIRYDTGEIVQVGFIDQEVTRPGCTEEGEAPSLKDTALSLTYWSLPYETFIPEPYRKRLGELKNKKRPFYFTVFEHTLLAYCQRWASKNDLPEALVVNLDFDDMKIQVMRDSYREVTGWENLPAEPLASRPSSPRTRTRRSR